MLSTKVQAFQQKVFLTIIAISTAIVLFFLIFHQYQEKQTGLSEQRKKQNLLKRSLMQHFEQKRENVLYISSFIQSSYEDISQQQRHLTRAKKHSIVKYFQSLRRDILVYAQNPFIVQVAGGLVQGYQKEKTKSNLWKKYNKSSAQLESFSKSKQMQQFYIVSPNGDVVWSTQKRQNPLFQKNLRSGSEAIQKAFVKGRQKTFISTLLGSSIFIATPVKKRNTVVAVLLFQREPVQNLLQNDIPDFISNIYIKVRQNDQDTKNLQNNLRKDAVKTEIFPSKSGLVMGSYCDITEYSCTLCIEQNLEKNLKGKLQTLRDFYHAKEQTNIHILASKVHKVWLSTPNTSTNRKSLIYFLKKQPIHKSFFVGIDENWNNIYISQKTQIDKLLIYTVVEVLPQRIERILQEHQESMSYRLLLGNQMPLSKQDTNIEIPIHLAGQEGLFILQPSRVNKSLLHDSVAWLILVVFLMVTIAISILVSPLEKLSKHANQEQDEKNRISYLLKEAKENLLADQREAQSIYARCKKMKLEIRNVLILNQTIFNIAKRVAVTFEKTNRVLEQKQSKEQVYNLTSLLLDHQRSIITVIDKAKNFSFTSNILSLNTNIEASLLDQKESFSVLAAEYQKMSSKMQKELQSIEHEIQEKIKQIKQIQSIHAGESLFIDALFRSIETRSEKTTELIHKCGDQRQIIKLFENLVEELEEICIKQIHRLESTSLHLENVVQIDNFSSKRLSQTPTLTSKAKKTKQKLQLIPSNKSEYKDF